MIGSRLHNTLNITRPNVVKPALQLKIGQQLTMTPQLQQAIRLLQLSAMDLQTEVQTALETNSMLELQETPQLDRLDPELPSISDSDRVDEEIDVSPWERIGSRPAPVYRDTPNNVVETLNGSQASLRDHLLWQLQLIPFSDTDRLIGATIIDAINEDGFLTCQIEEIIATVKQAFEVDKSEVEAVLHLIQRFDPIGVGARDLSECLKIQLSQMPARTPWLKQAQELVSHYLPLLAKRDYPALRRRLGLSLAALQEVIHQIQMLNPRPGTSLGGRVAEYIIPDVYAYKKHGKWVVKLNPDCTPKLQINDHYASFIRRADSSTDNQFMRNQLQEAKWFLKSIENRHETLLKVAQCIVAEQQAFLDFGEEAMKPLILHDIAIVLDLHESTISRVTTQKYLHTPRGTFELKYFFSSHVNTEVGGECSATAIRALIKKFIAVEDRKKPLSDSKLSSLLAELGIKVARRTVAKYREGLVIPPSNERKQLL